MPSSTLSAPVGGWNARDPLDRMPETDAIRMVNVFPETTDVHLRKGHSLHYDLGATRFDGLFELYKADGTKKLLGMTANGNAYEISNPLGPVTFTPGHSNGRFQGVMFRNVLLLVNGVDQPKQFDGTTLSDAAYTVVADDSTFIHVDVYKSRLYFTQVNSASIWYSASINQITGAVTEYDISGILRLGGYVMFAGSWTKDLGSGMQDLFVIISNRGEVLAFTGDNPGDVATPWQVAGRYQISPPLSRRSFCQFGSDLLILTYEGLIPMSEVMRDSNQPAKLTDKIQVAFNEAVRAYSDNYGWEVKWYPQGHYILVNVPVVENSIAEQYVMNTLTGAWCRFTGQNAATWCVYDSDLYFGSQRGSTVMKADDTYADYQSAMEVDLKSAFSYFEDREHIKHFQYLRPLLTTDSNIVFNLEVDVDFEDRIIEATASSTGADGPAWDTSTWDTESWGGGAVTSKDWYALNRVGRCAAYRLAGEFQNVSWTMSAANVNFAIGGTF